MAPAAGINSSPATPHNGSATPAVGATTSCWTTPGCGATGLMLGGFSGTVITSWRRWRWGAVRAHCPRQRGSGSLSCTPGVRPSPNVTFGVLNCGEGRGCSRSWAAHRTCPDSRPDPTRLDGRPSLPEFVVARGAAVDVVVAPVRTAARTFRRLMLFDPLSVVVAAPGVRTSPGRRSRRPRWARRPEDMRPATPTPAARRRFAWATVPLLRVAKTCRRRANCILACRRSASRTPSKNACKLTLASAIRPSTYARNRSMALSQRFDSAVR